MLPLILILFIGIGLYTLAILSFAFGIRHKRKAPAMDGIPSLRVSLLIPFRNERQALPLLLSDLMAQDYPKEQCEVLLVDDHSEDGTGQWISSKIDGSAGFQLLSLPPGTSGKKAALKHGIDHASHPYLIQVDADCRLGPEFISTYIPCVC